MLMNNDALRAQPFLAAAYIALFCKHYPLAYILTKIRVPILFRCPNTYGDIRNCSHNVLGLSPKGMSWFDEKKFKAFY